MSARRRKHRRIQQFRDITVAGAFQMGPSLAGTAMKWPIPGSRSLNRPSECRGSPGPTGRFRVQFVEAVIGSGLTGSETAVTFGVAWWMVRAGLTEAYVLTCLKWMGSARGCWASMNFGSGLLEVYPRPGILVADPTSAVYDHNR